MRLLESCCLFLGLRVWKWVVVVSIGGLTAGLPRLRTPRPLSITATPPLPKCRSSPNAPKCGIAETRAVNRALRKAYGVGIRSMEEIGPIRRTETTSRAEKSLPFEVPPFAHTRNGSHGARRCATGSAGPSVNISLIPI